MTNDVEKIDYVNDFNDVFWNEINDDVNHYIVVNNIIYAY